MDGDDVPTALAPKPEADELPEPREGVELLALWGATVGGREVPLSQRANRTLPNVRSLPYCSWHWACARRLEHGPSFLQDVADGMQTQPWNLDD